MRGPCLAPASLERVESSENDLLTTGSELYQIISKNLEGRVRPTLSVPSFRLLFSKF